MRKLLLATAALLTLSAPSWADSITVSAYVDGSLVAVESSADGSLDVSNQAFGSFFNLNSLSINTETFLAPPDILSTNTLNVNQTAGGNHQLVIDIKGIGLSGPGSVQNLLSSFSVTGLSTGWNAQEQTFINGGLLADTGVFTATSDSAFSINPALVTSLFSAEAIYTINSVGTGRFNGGVDISVAAVPGPIVGAGLPGMIAGCGALAAFLKRRRKAALA